MLEVYFTEKVIQNWVVKVGAEAIQGRQKDGNVVVSTESETLKIYFKQGYLEKNRTPGDLIEAIASFCSIEEKSLYLLTIAITETAQTIQECFQRHGIPTLNLDDEPKEEVHDFDDFDPRKLSSSSSVPASESHQHLRSPRLLPDLVLLFAPVGKRGSGTGFGGITLGSGVSKTGLTALIDDKFGLLGMDSLYSDDEDDKLSVESDADSTMSGTTIGGESSDVRIVAVPVGISVRGTMVNAALHEAQARLDFIGQRKVGLVFISQWQELPSQNIRR